MPAGIGMCSWNSSSSTCGVSATAATLFPGAVDAGRTQQGVRPRRQRMWTARRAAASRIPLVKDARMGFMAEDQSC